MFRIVRISTFSLALLTTVPLPLSSSEPPDSAGDTLSGLLPSVVKPHDRPFIVAGDLYVPPGTTVRIEKGTVFLFTSFAGLHVQGTLLAQGTPGDQIVFTSKNDRRWNPAAAAEAAPFDWNGIDVDEGSIGSELSDCAIRFSVFGLKSQTERLRLKDIRFAYNGKSDFSIKGERQKIETEHYSYGAARAISPAPPATGPYRRAGLRTTFRYAGVALAVGGLAAGLWGLSEYPEAKRRFREINTPDDKGALLYTSAEWQNAKRMRDRDLIALISGCMLGVIGAAGLIATFTF
jgi:hypothetical protein